MKSVLIFFFPFLAYTSPIVIVTMAIGDAYQELVRPGIENKRLYAEKQGYDFVYADQSLDVSRPPAWSKVLLILQVMEKSDAEWLFWSDADSLIMNLAYRLETFIDEDYHLIATCDEGSPINTGQFFIRNCEWSRDFLRKIYSRVEYIDHGWWEQGAIIEEITVSEVREKVKICPQRLFNSFLGGPLETKYKQGDFILHFAGIRGNSLKPCFEDYRNRVLDDPREQTLENYLSYYGIILQQKETFSFGVEKLNELYSLKNVAVLGVEKGVFCEAILKSLPDLHQVRFFQNWGDCFSSKDYFSKRSNPAKEFQGILPQQSEKSAFLQDYFKEKYRDLAFFEERLRELEEGPVDLIVIEKADRQSLLDAQVLADSHTLIWVNPYKGENRGIVNSLIREGKLELVSKHRYKGRDWVQLRYL